jgi:hypothetical protein
MAHIYGYNEVDRLLSQEIDFKKAARELRKLQIAGLSEEDAWKIYYDEFQDSPTLHYSRQLDKIVNKEEGKGTLKRCNKIHNMLCDLFDEVFTNLLNEELKNVKLTIKEN